MFCVGGSNLTLFHAKCYSILYKSSRHWFLVSYVNPFAESLLGQTTKPVKLIRFRLFSERDTFSPLFADPLHNPESRFC